MYFIHLWFYLSKLVDLNEVNEAIGKKTAWIMNTNIRSFAKIA